MSDIYTYNPDAPTTALTSADKSRLASVSRSLTGDEIAHYRKHMISLCRGGKLPPLIYKGTLHAARFL